MENIRYEMTPMEGERIRFILYDTDNSEVGCLYFEKAKRTFSRKPLTMDGYRCVDAKIGELFDRYGEITPKDIVGKCQDLIKEGGY